MCKVASPAACAVGWALGLLAIRRRVEYFDDVTACERLLLGRELDPDRLARESAVGEHDPSGLVASDSGSAVCGAVENDFKRGWFDIRSGRLDRGAGAAVGRHDRRIRCFADCAL